MTRHHLAGACRDLGRPSDAEAQWRAALAEQPGNEPAWRGLTDLVLAQERWQEAKAMVGEAEAGPPGPLLAAGLRGRMHLARKNYAEGRKRLESDIERWPRAWELRVLFSRVLFHEGKDWQATERALYDVFGADPGNEEARQQLAVALRQRGVGLNGEIPPELTLTDLYRAACRTPSAVSEQLPMLYGLARSCSGVTQLGIRSPETMTALLFARLKTLCIYNESKRPEVERLAALAGTTRITVHEADVLRVEIDETDMLYVALRATAEQLLERMETHAGKVRKFLVLHDTTTRSGRGQPEGFSEGGPALQALLARGTFRRKEGYESSNGLTVLERL